MRIQFMVASSLLFLLVVGGCGGSAEVEMKQARRSMEQARSLHADKLAPTDFEKAQTAWDHAQAAEKEGKTGAAKVMYSSAGIFFGKASDIARAKSAALTRELDNMQPAMARNLDQVKNDLAVNNLSPKQQSQVQALISEAEQGNIMISKLITQQDLPQAVATAKEVQTKIYHAQLILAGKKIK